MSPNQMTIPELLEHPNVSSLISIENKQKVIEHLRAFHLKPKEPLYIRVLIGAGAWFASFFLLIFVGMIIGFSEEVGAIVIGLGFLFTSVLIEKNSQALFLEQVSLVLAIAGNILFVGGLAVFFNNYQIEIAFFMHALVCSAMYILLNNRFYRFIAPLGLVIIAIIWVFDSGNFIFIHLVVLAEILLVGFLVIKKKPTSFLLPLTYAAYLMLPSTILFINLILVSHFASGSKNPIWLSSVLICCGLIWLYLHLAGGLKNIKSPWMIFLIGGTIALGAFSTPGVLVAIGLLVLGFAFEDRILTMISYSFLITFLSLFYYALSIDLFQKSIIIAGSGGLLLFMRWIVLHYTPKEPLT